MTEGLNSPFDRRELEQSIIDNAQKIQFDTEINSYNETAVMEFIGSWINLADYYKYNNDRDISVEMIREYIDWTNNFFHVWKDPRADRVYQEEAEEHLRELEHFMQKIIEYVEASLYPNGR